jgi:hypothetical protein
MAWLTRNKNFTGIILFALMGALVATICDGVHVYTQTLSYADPFLFGQAWWVLPGFILTFLLMEFAYLLLIKHLPASIPTQKSISPGNPRDFTEAVIIFALIYLLSGFGNLEPIILSVIFYGTFVIRWLSSYDKLWLLILSGLMAIGGMFVEGAISTVGWMTYHYTDFFHVPLWLGGLYLHGAFALREGMRIFFFKTYCGHLK